MIFHNVLSILLHQNIFWICSYGMKLLSLLQIIFYMHSVHRQYLITESICLCTYVYRSVENGGGITKIWNILSQKSRCSWRYLPGKVKKKCIRLAKMFVWVFPNILASPIKLIKQKAKRRCL